MQDGELTLEETAASTGATIRNIKYWSVVYDLEVHRRGRRNFYPKRTVELIRAITRLSDLQVYTTHFTRWLVDMALGRDLGDPERHARFQLLAAEIEDVLGIATPEKPGMRGRAANRFVPPSSAITTARTREPAVRSMAVYGDEDVTPPQIAQRHNVRDDESLL